MATITPNNQLRINDPYQQRLFDFNTSDSRLYLSRVSNQLLRLVGNDLVLKNFDILSITSSGSNAIVRINSGLAILDHTLIQVDDPLLQLELDVTPYDDTGHLIVHMNYQFLQTVEENPLRIKLSYVDSTGTTVSPDGWNWNKDRVILAIIEFTKNASNDITNIQEISDVVKSINIHGRTYYKLGYNPYDDQNLSEYFNQSSIINTKTTVSPTDLDKQPLSNKITTEDSSLQKQILTPQPDSETLNLSLINDEDSPGANYNYSTDSSGIKGWYPSPFSSDASLLDGNFIDESFLIFSPQGQIVYDTRGNISTINSTLRSGEQLQLTHQYNTNDDLIQVTATVSGQTIWVKYYTYNSNNDVSGWSVTVF